MPTLNERFNDKWLSVDDRKERPKFVLNEDRPVAEYWFLAGAKAEREEVLEIVIDYLRNRLQTLIAPEHINEIECRIKERDNG